MSRRSTYDRMAAEALAIERRKEAVENPRLMDEIDRTLAGRTRDVRLAGRLRELYRERTISQSSRIVRSWMAWVCVLGLLGVALNFSFLPSDIATQALVPCAIIVLSALSVITIYRESGWLTLQDSALVVGTFVILFAISIIGLIAGPEFYERYSNIMIFVALTAIVIFPVPLAWTWAMAATAVLLHLAMQLWSPLFDTTSAIATSSFFGIGLVGTVFARRSVTIISQKSFLLSLRDLKRVSDLAVANARLETLARTDPLTGVANRRWMTETMEALWRDGTTSRRVGILMCDVDHFKGLNDALGHLEGDRCLREVANVIRDCIRPELDHVARYGGEEFLVLLTDVDAFDARLAAERICRTMEAALLPNPGSGVSRYVTLSIGVSTNHPGHPISAERLQRRADEALYLAKSRGRNQVVADEESSGVASLPMLTVDHAARG